MMPNTSLLLISSFFVLHSYDHWPATHSRKMLRKFLASNHKFTTVTLEVESFDSNGKLYLFRLKQLKFYLPKMIYSFLFVDFRMHRQLWTAKKKQVYDKLTVQKLFATNSKVQATLTQKDQSPIKDHPKTKEKKCSQNIFV